MDTIMIVFLLIGVLLNTLAAWGVPNAWLSFVGWTFIFIGVLLWAFAGFGVTGLHFGRLGRF